MNSSRKRTPKKKRNIVYVICPVCGKEYQKMGMGSHLRKHKNEHRRELEKERKVKEKIENRKRRNKNLIINFIFLLLFGITIALLVEHLFAKP